MSRKFNKAVASTVACLVVTSVVQMPAFAATKLAGEGRIDTAIAIAQESWNNNWKGQTTVVLTSSNNDNLVDALAVAPLAFQEKAPILLTENGDVVNPKVMDELKAKKVTKVYLTAGTGVQSAKMEKQLTDAGMTVVRLGGNDRYETAKNIAAKLTKINGVAVVNGYAVIDALSVASTAAANGYAIAMASNADTLDVTIPKDMPVYAIGGSGVLSDALVTKLNAKRLGGADRYKTNAAVIEGLQTAMKFDKVYVANGMPAGNGVDALAGSVLAAQTNSPIVITGDSLDATQTAILAKKASKDVKVVQLGGAVSAVAELEKALTPVVSADLKVESVTATNLRNVTVSFSGALTEDTVTTSNITITDKNGNIMNGKSVAVNADTKTVVVTVDNRLSNQTSYNLNVSGVKDAAGKEIVKSSTAFTAFDAELPTVTGVTVNGPKTFTVNFSEPIDQLAAGVTSSQAITVKSGDFTVGVQNVEISGATAQVTLYSDLTDKTSYNVSVNGFLDFAGYSNKVTTQKVDYVKDVTPAVAKITKVDQKFVVVEFSKAVSGLKAEQFYHTFSAWKANNIYKDADKTELKSGDAVTKVYVYFDTYTLPAGNINVGITSKVTVSGTDFQIVDGWANKFADAVMSVSVVADTVAPTVASVEVTGEDKLKVKFNKEVNFKTDNIEILDKDGKKIDGLSFSLDKTVGKEFVITLTKKMPAKSITLNIKDVKDTALAQNKLAAMYTSVIAITDKKAPEVEKVTLKKTASEQSLYVFFTEKVTETALNIANYLAFNGTTYSKLAGSVVTVSDKTVKITLSNDEYKAVNVTGTKLFVSGINDVAANTIAPALTPAIIAYDDAKNAPTISSVEATGTKTLKVTFNQYLTRVDGTAFTLGADSATIPAGISVSTNDDGNSVITLTSQTAFKGDATNVKFALTTSSAIMVTNSFGVTAVSVDNLKADDKIAPAVMDGSLAVNEPVLDKDRKEIAKKGQVTLKFTENLDVNSVSKFTFKVAGYTVTNATVSGDTVVLKLDKEITIAKLIVTQDQNIADLVGNTFKSDKDIEVTVK